MSADDAADARVGPLQAQVAALRAHCGESTFRAALVDSIVQCVQIVSAAGWEGYDSRAMLQCLQEHLSELQDCVARKLIGV